MPCSSFSYGFVAIVGVFISKLIIKRMSKSVFTKYGNLRMLSRDVGVPLKLACGCRLEYSLMTYASFRLISAGLAKS